METNRVCRLCGTVVDSKRAVALFKGPGVRQNLPSRISKLIDIPEPAPDDLLPPTICEKCKGLISSLEKALVDLNRLKDIAARSLLKTRGMKRTKETSGEVGVSPDTIRQRPRSKQARKRLTFESK